MNTREIFLNTFNGVKVDRKFRWETMGAWPETINRWHKEGLPESIDFIKFFDYFEMDPMGRIPIISTYKSPYYPVFEMKQIEEDEETFTIIDTDGIKKKQIKKDIWLSMPQFLEFPVKSEADYDKIRYRFKTDTEGRIGMTLQELRKKYLKREYPLGMYICGGFGHPRELMGLETYLMTLYDNPKFIHKIMSDWLMLYKDFTKDVINAVELDYVYIWEDMAYKNGPLISPKQYEEFIAPYMKELIDSIRKNGVNIILLDSDGNISKLIPDFIECGINVLMPFEVQADMNIRDIRDEYPDVGIIGGLDKNVLALDKKSIEKEVKDKVPYLYDTGKYIAGIDHSVPPNVPFENYRYFVKLVRSIS